MQSELERKLARLEQGDPLDPRRVTLLLCPPVAWWRVALGAYVTPGVLRRVGLDSDYVRQNTRFDASAGAGLERYWKQVGREARRMVSLIRKTRIGLVIDAGWRDLGAALREDREVVFLVAHHTSSSDPTAGEGEMIELADGVRPWAEVHALLAEVGSGRVVLDVCSSKDWRDDLRRTYPGLSSVSGGPHVVNLVEALRMAALFANACDGNRTFEEAWSLAETKYWQGGKTN